MNKVSRYFVIWLMAGLVLSFSSCGEEDDVDPLGNWVERSDFEGLPRGDAVSFVINGRAFVATGFDGYDRLSDLWEYDYEFDYWIQRADFPGAARNGAVGFSINGKGYLGTGYDGENRLNDFWEYDPVEDSWKQLADFKGSARYGAIGFSLDGKGYIGTGTDGNDLKDLWVYDPETNIWTQGVSVGGSKRVDAFAFVIDGKAYVGGGRNNGVYEDDFWEYDPATTFWTEKTGLSNTDDDDEIEDYLITRSNATSFEMNGKGYISLGFRGSNLNSIWEYDPGLDAWEEKADFEGSARRGAVVLAYGYQTYILTGTSGGTAAFDDVWQFFPDVENNEDD
ncbi:MAG: kelch repeat-containing protein [Bacteroidia bacterium]